MKTRTIVLSFLAVVMLLGVFYDATSGKSKGDENRLKVGVISVRQIFQQCKRIDKYRQETIAERDKAESELEALAKEIETEREGLKALKVGSADYNSRMRDIMAKQASARAQQQFYEQQWMMKEQEVIEKLYKDILEHIRKVAKEKGLELVFEKSEPEFPAPSAKELNEAISTHKLLYSDGCLDITSDVIALVDSGK